MIPLYPKPSVEDRPNGPGRDGRTSGRGRRRKTDEGTLGLLMSFRKNLRVRLVLDVLAHSHPSDVSSSTVNRINLNGTFRVDRGGPRVPETTRPFPRDLSLSEYYRDPYVPQ